MDIYLKRSNSRSAELFNVDGAAKECYRDELAKNGFNDGMLATLLAVKECYVLVPTADSHYFALVDLEDGAADIFLSEKRKGHFERSFLLMRLIVRSQNAESVRSLMQEGIPRSLLREINFLLKAMENVI